MECPQALEDRPLFPPHTALPRGCPRLPQHRPPAGPSPLYPCRAVMGPATACLRESGEQFPGTQGSHKLQEMKAPEQCLLLTHNSSLIKTGPGHNARHQSRVPRDVGTALGFQSGATRVGEGLPTSLGSAVRPRPHRVGQRGRTGAPLRMLTAGSQVLLTSISSGWGTEGRRKPHVQDSAPPFFPADCCFLIAIAPKCRFNPSPSPLTDDSLTQNPFHVDILELLLGKSTG